MGSDTSWSPGNFSYPPQGSSLQFNYIDSVITSWLTFDPDATGCLLSIWYWHNTNPWRIGFNQTAPANGTEMVPLDLADSSYLGQLNFNYNASDGSPQVFLSPIFTVDTSPQSRAITWSQGVLSLSTSSASAALQTSISASLVTSSALSTLSTTSDTPQTSISASLVTSSASPTPSTTSDRPSSVLHSFATSSPLSVSKTSPTNGSDLAPGAIAGIIVGVVVCVGLAAALIFVLHRRRKAKNVQAEVKAALPASFQPRFPANFVGEKDGSPLRPNELSGDSHLLEMATNSR